MQTLNNILNGLNRIATAHRQIDRFGFGDLHEFETSGVTQYPAMFVEGQPVVKERRLTKYRMRVYLFDKVLKDESNETEVLSDLIRLAEDLIAEIKPPSWTWYAELGQTPTIEYDTERTMDWLAGAWFDVEFRLPNKDDRCQIPQDSITRF